MEDCLIIGCDFSSEEDHICLTVVRRSKTGDRVLNRFFDEEAKKIYQKLTEGGSK